jgi:hypothetical protein
MLRIVESNGESGLKTLNDVFNQIDVAVASGIVARVEGVG